MICNVGKTDRTIRIILGVILLAVGYFGGLPVWGAMSVYAVGAIALITGLTRFCLLWKVLGINTCETHSSGKGTIGVAH
ncbi:MAG: DUF2892 domain-containing protein [Candidatus Manganitrophaceae bacterium]